MRPALLLPLLLLPLLPTAGAVDPVVAELDVASGTLAGDVHGVGSLRAYVDERFRMGDGPSLLHLLLRADDLRVTAREANATVVAERLDVDPSFRTQPPRTDVHADAVLRSEATRVGYTLGVFPLRPDDDVRAAVAGPCATLGPAGQQTASTRDHIRPAAPEDDPTYWTPVRDALRWDPCPGTVTLTGDLLVVLWEVDVRVWDDDGDHAHWSGRRGQEEVPGAVRSDEKRQLVLEARNATLELEVSDDSDERLFVAAPRVELDGSASFLDARGRVDGGAGWSTVRGAASFDGSLTVRGDVGAEPDRLAVHVSGRASAVAGGAPVPSGDEWPVPAWAVWVAFTAVALAAGGLAVRRRHGPRVAAWLRPVASSAAQAGRYGRATLLASLAVWSDPRHGDGYVLRALARGSRRRWVAALRDHTRAHHRSRGHARGLNAFEAARVCSVRGRAAEAAHWLAIAVRHDVRLLDEAAMDPDFGRVAGHEAFQRVVRGHLPASVGA